MTLHIAKRLNQNKGKCDAEGCAGRGHLRINIATGSRGGPGDFVSQTACTWPCAEAICKANHNNDSYLWEDEDA